MSITNDLTNFFRTIGRQIGVNQRESSRKSIYTAGNHLWPAFEALVEAKEWRCALLTLDCLDEINFRLSEIKEDSWDNTDNTEAFKMSQKARASLMQKLKEENPI